MATLEVICPHCRQSLDAPEDCAGATVECPACNQEFLIPATAGSPASTPATACPACKSAMEAGAVLCVACGYHLTLKKRMQTRFG